MKRIFSIIAACATLVSCSQNAQLKLIPAGNFDATVDGKEVSLHTLRNGGLTMQVTNFGGRVVSLWVKFYIVL